MQMRWAECKDLAWGHDAEQTPYFFYCADCHVKKWPGDVRSNNRHSRPGGATECSIWKRCRHGVSQTVAGAFALTVPPQFEPTESTTPPAPKRAKKMAAKKKVSWGDRGAWSRNPGTWIRSFEERLADLAAAEALQLVEVIVPSSDVARRCDYFRVGPCDGCGSRVVKHHSFGALYDVSGTKQVFQLCDKCQACLATGSRLYSEELEDWMFLCPSSTSS